MKKLLLTIVIGLGTFASNAQCSTTNATGCVCEDGSQTCFLLPDITASWKGISNNGYIEYAQTGEGTNYTGQGPDNGRLRVSGSTPNIGHGSFTVRGVDNNGKRAFICGTDTIYNVNGTGAYTCPNGDPNPRQMVIQRIYHKNGNNMTYTDKWTGSMTYHPSHGHNHVDDWAVMTLRLQTADPNPLNWPIVGEGAKIGFCLMDYGQCGNTGTTYDGHCRDNNTVYLGGNVLYNADFPNWNLGGGNYNCSVTEQGISSGWTDVYGKHLDGMWINIPANTCNGDYYIVLEIDRLNAFEEENENNNYTAVPVTLTKQLPAGTAQTPLIWANGTNVSCSGSEVTLTATGGSNYLWSNGETTQSITVTDPGAFTCEVTNYCGTATSAPFIVESANINVPAVEGDTVCVEGSMTLNATSTGTLKWYDDQGNFLTTGNSYTTPVLTSTTTYYVKNEDNYTETFFAEPHDIGTGGGGSYVSTEQYILFDAITDLTVKSAKINAQAAGTITVEVIDGGTNLMHTQTFNVPAGESRIDFTNFTVPTGYNFRLQGTDMSTGLWRNNNAASYPYTTEGIIKITGSSAGANYYYYFYDLEVEASNGICESDPVPVVAYVDACLGLGEDVVFKNSIKLAPNPNNGQFNVSFFMNESTDVTLELINMVGSTVYSKTITTSQGQFNQAIDAGDLSKGVYLMNVVYNGKSYVQKLVIE